MVKNDEQEQAKQSIPSLWSGSEAYALPPVPSFLDLAEAGAVMMGRFRNRLEQLEREHKRPLPHRFTLKIDGLRLVCESEIY